MHQEKQASKGALSRGYADATLTLSYIAHSNGLTLLFPSSPVGRKSHYMTEPRTSGPFRDFSQGALLNVNLRVTETYFA